MSTTRRILQPAPDPRHVPPVSIATRQDLFGATGAMLLLTAAEAGDAKAAELDGELLSCYAIFHEDNRADTAANRDPDLTDEGSGDLREARNDLLER